MSKYAIFDYVHPTEGNVVKRWSLALQKKERAKLNQRLDSLALHGPDLIPGLLSPTGVPNIFKLKIKGRVQLRPMVCEGPGSELAYTLLLGAKEISDEYDPPNAPERAADIRKDLLAHPERKVQHERVA
jgi:hypothetical protein